MQGPTLSQKLTAEVIGTAILVFIGAGSVPLTVFLTGKNPFGSAELSTISFAFAFAIFAAVYSVGHISGCHMNPAVTIALAATRKVDWSTGGGPTLVRNWLAQSWAQRSRSVVLIGNDPASTLGLGLPLGTTRLRVGCWSPLLLRAIGTAILVFTVFGSAVDGPGAGPLAGIIIGFIVYGIIILVGPITGAALNPAHRLVRCWSEGVIGYAKFAGASSQSTRRLPGGSGRRWTGWSVSVRIRRPPPHG